MQTNPKRKIINRPHPFVDVPQDAWYSKAVAWAYINGITIGVDDTHFDPNRSMTRAELVTMLWRIANIDI